MSAMIRLVDAAAFEPYLPDMVEEVRFLTEPGKAPALVVVHRKMNRSLAAQLRHVVDTAPDKP